MVDRDNRNKLINQIHNFLNKKIDSLAFDEAIFDIDTKTEDETIHFIVSMLWLYYDDPKSHKIAVNKEG